MARVFDSFTDSDGTNLASHIGDMNATWVEHSSYVAGDYQIYNNRARPNTGPTAYYISASPDSADYIVSAELTVVSDTGDVGIVGRVDTGADTMYLFRYYSGNWELYKGVAGTYTLLGSYAQALAVNQTYFIILSMVGTAIRAYVDGYLAVSVVDSDITAIGKAGVRSYLGATTTTSYHLNNFMVDYTPYGLNAIPMTFKVGTGSSVVERAK